MSVAIRAATRIQDMDDANVTPAVGVDEYVLTYDHDTAKFVLRAPAAPFAGILATGATVGATAQAQVFNYGIKANETRQAVAGLIARSGAWPTPSNILELYDHNNGLRAYMTSAGGLRLAAVGNTGPFAGIDTQGLVVGYFEMGTVANRDLYKSNNSDLSLASSGTTAVSLNCSDGVGSGGMKVGSGTGTTPVFSVSGAGVVTLTAGIRPAADSTTALQLQKSNGTAIITVDTTNSRVGIGMTPEQEALHVNGSIQFAAGGLIGYRVDSTTTIAAFRNASTALNRIYTGYTGAKELRVTEPSLGASVASFRMDVEPRLGVGTENPATILHATSTTATTDALRNLLTLGSNVTGAGVGDTNLGAGIVFQAESSTTVDTTQARIAASWIVATHATRTSRLALSAYDTAEREGIRIDSDGAAALLGFYAHAAVAQQVLATGAGATADNIITALQALGLVKQS